MTSVLIADDQALLRAGFRVLLETAGFDVVGEAADGGEAVALAASTAPEVVLMDVRMPVMDGIEATSRICASSSTRVLILTMFHLDSYVYDALRAGASGFLLKDTPPEELLRAVEVIAGGDALLAPAVTRRLIADFAARPRTAVPPSDSLEGVTDREREVLTLVGLGLSNTEIAERLHVTLATVKSHIGRLLAKLRARDRAHLVIAAYESGLVSAREH